MATALFDDDAAFDRSLARQYANGTWSNLAFVYIGGPVACVVVSLMPFGGVMLGITLMLIVAGAAASVLRAASVPAAVKPHASGVERFVQFGAGLFPVLAIGLPVAAYAGFLLVMGSLASMGVL